MSTVSIRRLWALSVCFCVVFVFLAAPAFAATENAAPQGRHVLAAPSTMGEMTQAFYSWYLLFRNRIAFPLLILTYGVSGIQILCSTLLTPNNANRSVDKAKQRVAYATVALGVLLFLPTLITSVRGLVESSQWRPSPIQLLPGLRG